MPVRGGTETCHIWPQAAPPRGPLKVTTLRSDPPHVHLGQISSLQSCLSVFPSPRRKETALSQRLSPRGKQCNVLHTCGFWCKNVSLSVATVSDSGKKTAEDLRAFVKLYLPQAFFKETIVFFYLISVCFSWICRLFFCFVFFKFNHCPFAASFQCSLYRFIRSVFEIFTAFCLSTRYWTHWTHWAGPVQS